MKGSRSWTPPASFLADHWSLMGGFISRPAAARGRAPLLHPLLLNPGSALRVSPALLSLYCVRRVPQLTAARVVLVERSQKKTREWYSGQPPRPRSYRVHAGRSIRVPPPPALLPCVHAGHSIRVQPPLAVALFCFFKPRAQRLGCSQASRRLRHFSLYASSIPSRRTLSLATKCSAALLCTLSLGQSYLVYTPSACTRALHVS